MIFKSTYNLLSCLSKNNPIIIRFYQKHSTELYPEIDFGDDNLKKELISPLSIWLFEGEGTMPYSSVDIVFSIMNGELDYDFQNEEIDLEYFDEDYDSDYFLDINLLKDDYKYFYDIED